MDNKYKKGKPPMKKAVFVLICSLMVLAGCESAINSVTSSVTDFMVDHVPMSKESKDLAQARSDLAKVQLKISKTEQDLADARQLNIDSHNGIMEAMGHPSGPSMAKDMVESSPTPYVAEQVQMHRLNQEVAQKEINRCQHDLGRLRGQEKALQQKVQELEKVAGPKPPEPDGGGGGGGGGSC
jgi:predicted lipoprotein